MFAVEPILGRFIDVQTPNGEHLYRTTAQVAEFLVAEGRAENAQANGRVRSVKLIETAQTHATRTGEAQPLTNTSYGTRFVRKVQTEAGKYYEHHPRATDYNEIP